MKKMLLGIFLLVMIIAAVTVNSCVMHNKLTQLQESLIESLSLSPSLFEDFIEESFREWEEKKKYLGLMISENRLDIISDAYFECLKSSDMLITKDKLIYEISQLIKSETLYLDSIF